MEQLFGMASPDPYVINPTVFSRESFQNLPIVRTLQAKEQLLKRVNENNDKKVVYAARAMAACLCLTVSLMFASSLATRTTTWIFLSVKLLGVGSSITFIGFAAVIIVLSFKCETNQREIAMVRHQVEAEYASRLRMHSEMERTLGVLEESHRTWDEVQTLKSKVYDLFKMNSLLIYIPVLPKDEQWSNSPSSRNINTNNGTYSKNLLNGAENGGGSTEDLSRISKCGEERSRIWKYIGKAEPQTAQNSNQSGDKNHTEEQSPSYNMGEEHNNVKSVKRKAIQRPTLNDENCNKHLLKLSKTIWESQLKDNAERKTQDNITDIDKQIRSILNRMVDQVVDQSNSEDDMSRQMDSYLKLIDNITRCPPQKSTYKQRDSLKQRHSCHSPNTNQSTDRKPTPKPTSNSFQYYIPNHIHSRNASRAARDEGPPLIITDYRPPFDVNRLIDNALIQENENFEYSVRLNRLDPRSSHNIYDALGDTNNLRHRNADAFDSGSQESLHALGLSSFRI